MANCKAFLALVLAGFLTLCVGCGSSDTSDGFKPPPQVSKADIQKQIDSVQADTTLQPGQKAMVIGNLQKKLAAATK